MCQGLRLKGQGDRKEEPDSEMLHKLKTSHFSQPRVTTLKAERWVDPELPLPGPASG